MSSPVSTRDFLIRTDRPDEAREFTAGVPGFSVFADKPRMRGLETGAVRLSLDPAPPPGPVLELAVDDLQAMTATLVAVGCAVVREDAWSRGAPSAIRSA